MIASLSSLFSNLLPFLAAAIVFVVGWIVLRKLLVARPVASRLRDQSILLAFGFVGGLVVLLMLPLGSATRGQILSFLGILFSAAIALSATTFLGNALGGLMLRIVRNFRIGDFIRVGDHAGRVSERGLFHIELQTEDGELTTVPNLLLVTQAVTVVPPRAALVSAKVSLGYDVSRAVVEAHLLEAAAQCELSDGFVQVLELGDFSVLYRVAGLLDDAQGLIAARSQLRAAMLDALHGGGVEIVSPNFMNTRAFDPDRAFVPATLVTAGAVDSAASVDAVIFAKAEAASDIDMESEELTAQLTALRSLTDAGDGPADAAEQEADLLARLAAAEARTAQLDADVSGQEP